MSDITPYSAQWAEEPEPALSELDPQVVLDCNISGQAWLWDTSNEGEGYLVYEGEPMDLSR